MAAPKFGEIGADKHFGYQATFFNVGTETNIPNDTYLDVAVALFTMPFSGAVMVKGLAYFYINSASFQEAYAYFQCFPNRAPDYQPYTYINNASATNPWPIFTLPVYARWDGVAEGTTNQYIGFRLVAGAWGPAVVFRKVFGYYTFFRY